MWLGLATWPKALPLVYRPGLSGVNYSYSERMHAFELLKEPTDLTLIVHLQIGTLEKVFHNIATMRGTTKGSDCVCEYVQN